MSDEKPQKSLGSQKPAPAPEGAEEVASSNHQLLESSPHPNMLKSIWALPPSIGCRINPATLLSAEPFLQLLVLPFLPLCQTRNRPQQNHLTEKQEDEKTAEGKRKKNKASFKQQQPQKGEWNIYEKGNTWRNYLKAIWALMLHLAIQTGQPILSHGLMENRESM